MREIQDLTLHLSRGLERVEQRFEREAVEFENHAPTDRPMGIAGRLALRATALPTNGDLYIDKVYGVDPVTPLRQSWTLRHGPKPVDFPLHYLSRMAQWRLIVRGTRLDSGTSPEFREHIHLYCDGTLTYWLISDTSAGGVRIEHVLYPPWIMSMVLNAIYSADRLRQHTGMHGIEFGLEVQISNSGVPVRGLRLGARGAFDPVGEIAAPGVLFPRYVIGPPDALLDAFRAFFVDYWAALGLDARAEEVSGIVPA